MILDFYSCLLFNEKLYSICIANSLEDFLGLRLEAYAKRGYAFNGATYLKLPQVPGFELLVFYRMLSLHI